VYEFRVGIAGTDTTNELLPLKQRQMRGPVGLVVLHISKLHIYTPFSSKIANDHYKAGVPRPLESGNTPPIVGLYCAHSKEPLIVNTYIIWMTQTLECDDKSTRMRVLYHRLVMRAVRARCNGRFAPSL
jgi:hypothetical protein